MLFLHRGLVNHALSLPIFYTFYAFRNYLHQIWLLFHLGMWYICGVWARENVQNCTDKLNRLYPVYITGTEPTEPRIPPRVQHFICTLEIASRDRPRFGRGDCSVPTGTQRHHIALSPSVLWGETDCDKCHRTTRIVHGTFCCMEQSIQERGFLSRLDAGGRLRGVESSLARLGCWF